jgi:hypothetical protein
MRRWFGVIAAMIAVSVSAHAAEDEARASARPGPALARGEVPLPRPKPGDGSWLPTASDSSQPARELNTEGALTTNRRGELNLVLDRMKSERDPYSAAELQPAEVTSWSKEDIQEAQTQCGMVLAALNIEADVLPPIGGPGGCGIAAPVKISRFGAVEVKPPATLNCRLAAAIYKWLTDVVQPSARRRFGEPVVGMVNASAYSCRRRNAASTGRISEHSFGNALDMRSFRLASGKEISVLGEWSTAGAFFGIFKTSSFLSDIHNGACPIFSTVMGPRANAAHDNHFHVDLGRDGAYKFCK